MKIYAISSRKDGGIYEPVYTSKKEAKEARYRKGMPDPSTTEVRTLIVADSESNGNINGENFIQHMKKLRHSGMIRGDKPVVVFGPTPGLVTEVTAGIGGNLTLIYRPLEPGELHENSTPVPPPTPEDSDVPMTAPKRTRRKK